MTLPSFPQIIQPSLSQFHLHHLDQEWVHECLEYVSSQPRGTSSVSDMFMQQVLHSDLSEIVTSSPLSNQISSSLSRQGHVREDVDLSEVHNITVTNTVVQTLDVLNISCSVMSLLNRVREIQSVQKTGISSGSRNRIRVEPSQQDTDPSQEHYGMNASNEVPSRTPHLPQGIHKLMVSDGVVTLAAMEYETFPGLDMLLPLGCKLFIKKAIIRRGVLLFSPRECQILGGSCPEWNVGTVWDRLEKRFCEILEIPYNPPVAKETPPTVRQSNNTSASSLPSAPRTTTGTNIPSKLPQEKSHNQPPSVPPMVSTNTAARASHRVEHHEPAPPPENDEFLNDELFPFDVDADPDYDYFEEDYNEEYDLDYREHVPSAEKINDSALAAPALTSNKVTLASVISISSSNSQQPDLSFYEKNQAVLDDLIGDLDDDFEEF